MNEPALGIYEHYSGTQYRVIGVARHSESKEQLVVYQRLDDHALWTRPLTMFLEDVEVEGRRVPRFRRVG